MSTPVMSNYIVLSAEHAKLLFPNPEHHALRAMLVKHLASGACVVQVPPDDPRGESAQIHPLVNGVLLADAFEFVVKINTKGERFVRLRQGSWAPRTPVQLKAWNDLPGAGQVFLNRKGQPTQVFFPDDANRDQVLREVREMSGYGVRLHPEEEAVSLGVRCRVEVAYR